MPKDLSFPLSTYLRLKMVKYPRMNDRSMPLKLKDPPAEEDAAWKAVGFHRPLAGILYNLVFIIIAAGFGASIRYFT